MHESTFPLRTLMNESPVIYRKVDEGKEKDREMKREKRIRSIWIAYYLSVMMTKERGREGGEGGMDGGMERR